MKEKIIKSDCGNETEYFIDSVFQKKREIYRYTKMKKFYN